MYYLFCPFPRSDVLASLREALLESSLDPPPRPVTGGAVLLVVSHRRRRRAPVAPRAASSRGCGTAGCDSSRNAPTPLRGRMLNVWPERTACLSALGNNSIEGSRVLVCFLETCLERTPSPPRPFLRFFTLIVFFFSLGLSLPQPPYARRTKRAAVVFSDRLPMGATLFFVVLAAEG